MIRVCEFIITGRVQGVGLRYYIRELGLSLEVRGEVWNSSDGTVKGVVVVGTNSNKFLKGLRDGPGEVDAVMRNDNLGSDYDSFEIGPTH